MPGCCEVGVDTVNELRYRNPARLAKSMAEANKRRKLVRFLPSEKLVRRWVEHARRLPAEDHVLIRRSMGA